MSSAKYFISETNETMFVEKICRHFNLISFSSWTYAHLLSTATIEKNDLSFIGYLTGLICLGSILFSFSFRIPIHFFARKFVDDDDDDSTIERSPSEIETAEPSIVSSNEKTTTDF